MEAPAPLLGYTAGAQRMDQRGSHTHTPLIPFAQLVPLTGTILAGASFLVRCSMTPALACCCEGARACPRLQVVVHLPIS